MPGSFSAGLSVLKTGGAGGTASCQGFRGSAPKPCATPLCPRTSAALFAGAASMPVFLNALTRPIAGGSDCRKTPGRHRRAAALRFWFRNRRRVRRFRLPCAARLSLRSLPPSEPQASRQRALPVRKDRPQASFFDGLTRPTAGGYFQIGEIKRHDG